MREFYVYGFKSRDEFSQKSARSYDDERRRIESWLGDYMGFRQTTDGKKVFLSIDSRVSCHNPLFKAWKAKSFTDGDITLHFILFDILHSPEISMTHADLMKEISEHYLSIFDTPMQFDESTLRKKLKEYVEETLLVTEKRGKQVFYQRTKSIDLSTQKELLDFFSEIAPCGVVGSFLLDKGIDGPETFAFKHHYITPALDSEILCQLFVAMGEKRAVLLDKRSRYSQLTSVRVVPLRIFSSAQNGRQYLLGFDPKMRQMRSFRLDYIDKVKQGETCLDFDSLRENLDRMQQHMWGVTTAKAKSVTEHVEFTIHAGDGEEYIYQRLEREKRCGSVDRIDSNTYRFSADVYDSTEMVPWIRSFICRIESLQFSNRQVEEQFRSDFRAMACLYGIDQDNQSVKPDDAITGGEDRDF